MQLTVWQKEHQPFYEEQSACCTNLLLFLVALSGIRYISLSMCDMPISCLVGSTVSAVMDTVTDAKQLRREVMISFLSCGQLSNYLKSRKIGIFQNRTLSVTEWFEYLFVFTDNHWRGCRIPILILPCIVGSMRQIIDLCWPKHKITKNI